MTVRRNLSLAVAANTLGLTAHTTYMYYLAPIALRAGGIEGRDAVIFSLVALAMGIAVVPAGRLTDRIPRRYAIRVSLALLGLSYLGVFVTPTLLAVAAGTIASGVGLALLFVAFNSYVADLLEASERGAAYGRAGALAVLATAVGPFLAALVFRVTESDITGLRVNALLFSLAALVGIALTVGLPSTRALAFEPRERGRWSDAARAAGPIAAMYLLMGAGYGMTAPYFTVYFLDHIQLPNEHWGYLLAGGTVASAAGSLIAGDLGRRHSGARVAIVGMVGLVLSSLLLAFPLALAFLVLGFLGRSIFSTTVAPGMSAVIMSRAKAAQRAEAQAYGSLAWNTGWAVGAGAGGALLMALGGRMFALGGTLALAGVVLGVALLRRPRTSASASARA